MCCYLFRKGNVCQALWWHSVIYLITGLSIMFCYLGLSIAFYEECNLLNVLSLYPFQCGSNAMWACMGWVPFAAFMVIILLTFYYLHKQSSSTMKVLTSSDAWLILFTTVACCVLFFIHICYLAYICVELLDNAGCSPETVYHPQIAAVDCTKANKLIGALLFFSICTMVFIYVSLTMLFALVNGRIATPVNYKTVKQFPSNMDAPNNNMDKDGEISDSHRMRQRRENLAAHNLGDRVIVRLSYDTDPNPCYGIVKWYGQVKSTEYPTESTTALPFLYGVRLDQKRGTCDGSIRGKHPRPFVCPSRFGVFVPINHITALPKHKDPTKQQHNGDIPTDNAHTYASSNRSSINKGLVITRGQDPNHLHQGELFFFLRKLTFSGMLHHSKIGVMDYSDKIESIKTKSMISVIFPTTNKYIYNYLPLLSKTSEYDEIFNPERNSQLHLKEYKHDAIDEEKEKEEDLNVPIVEIWYLNLHESWSKNTKQIKLRGVSDYRSSQWVIQSEQRALHWYSLINIDKTTAVKYRFDEAPLPLFFKHKTDKHRTSHDDDDDMKWAKDGLYSCVSPHYVPLGIFHNKANAAKNEVAWLESEPFTNIIVSKHGQITLRFKRLIHEAVDDLKDILPYLHSKRYKVDASDRRYGWFPMDWVYAEVDIDDNELENAFCREYSTYTAPFDDDHDVDKKSYNPYWFMKYPRIPLFIVSIRLPLKELQQYTVEVIQAKYGQYSPKQHNHAPPTKTQRVHQPPIKTSIDIDKYKDKRDTHAKKHYKSKSNAHYVDENEHMTHGHKYVSKHHRYDDNEDEDESEMTVSVERELGHISHHDYRKKKKTKNVANVAQEYEFVEQSDDDEDGESEYEDDEETLSNEEEDSESDENDENDEDQDKTEDESESEEDEDEDEDDEEEETASSESEDHGAVRYKQKPEHKPMRSYGKSSRNRKDR